MFYRTSQNRVDIRIYLEDTGIDYVDESGLYADFHSLRHTTGSLLVASGANPKIVQAIMRHSDINLTMSRYSHTFRGQEANAIAALPDLSAPSSQRQVKTGTDAKPVDAVRKQLTPKRTPYLTPFPVPSNNSLSSVGNGQSKSAENHLDPNSLVDSKLSTENNNLSSSVRGKSGIRPAGLEPAASGLGNRGHKNTTTDQTKTCETTKEPLTPQLTQKSSKQGKIDTAPLPSDLAEIIRVWPALPEHIRAAIKALAGITVKPEDK